MFADDPPSSGLFREVRGTAGEVQSKPPWLDIEQAALIAVNRIPYDDIPLALDHRTDPTDPRVMRSDFWSNPQHCEWRTVTPAFSAFVDALEL
ncbi:hypothetical protein SBI_03814 [Streptomyces bingchenggensis BCW-1]|uniref:Uncharacterized protein n=1 Tax=Streptomyces bingchenggensis (strain BCW-1) TaxID=749414 RepID=D7CG27_STRBB|nr:MULTISPECIES: hypothetical protein [Streptomyces]ADI06935.1 hypothetical protein SBI_03814 [Streptomyces bingchenggensis BCW-1]